jgi:hypothetical protein
VLYFTFSLPAAPVCPLSSLALLRCFYIVYPPPPLLLLVCRRGPHSPVYLHCLGSAAQDSMAAARLSTYCPIKMMTERTLRPYEIRMSVRTNQHLYCYYPKCSHPLILIYNLFLRSYYLSSSPKSLLNQCAQRPSRPGLPLILIYTLSLCSPILFLRRQTHSSVSARPSRPGLPLILIYNLFLRSCSLSSPPKSLLDH